MFRSLGCLILISVCLITAGNANAGAIKNDDFEIWTELKYSHPFGKSPWTLHWATENRWGNDVSDYITFNTTLGFDYKFKKWLKAGFFYRFEKVISSPPENRIFPQVELSHRMGPFDLSTRQRFEVRIFPDETRFRYRPRFKIALPIKGKPVAYAPFVSDEFMVESGRGLNQNRMAFGNSFIFQDGHISFDLYYMLRRDKAKDTSEWTNRHILGTSLAFKY